MLTVAPDGNSATDLGVAANADGTPASDTISVSVNVGGKSFAATLALTISPEPQVLTSIAIVPGVASGPAPAPTA